MNTSVNKNKKRWLTFYVKSRCERKVDIALQERNISAYLPLQKKVRKWSDRRKLVEEPLFKGYIFAHVNERERLVVLQSPGVVKTITFAGKISVIPDVQIESIKKAIEFRSEHLSVEYTFKAGERVKIISGPFIGLSGRVKRMPDGKYIYIDIEGIEKSLKFKLSAEDLVKIYEPIEDE